MQYKADLVMGRDGKVLAGVAYEKLRYYPPGGGSSTCNRTARRPDIVDAAARVARELGWLGFCDFDFITDPRDGVVRLMEINPRFPECYRATVAAGLDMTELVYQLAHGADPAPQVACKEGRLVRFLPGDLLWFLTSPDRFKDLGSFLDFWSANVSYQLTSARDPGPIMGYMLENLAILFDREARQSRFRLKQALRR
jgi:predicted ATP-grasp superfamily ATP-dependent carboligase